VFQLVFSLLAAVWDFFGTRRDTALEVLTLRQQLAVLKRKRPRSLSHIAAPDRSWLPLTPWHSESS
jgi:hypothetical protein